MFIVHNAVTKMDNNSDEVIAIFLTDLPHRSPNFPLPKASAGNRVFIISRIFTQDNGKWHQSARSQMVSYLCACPCEKPCEYRLLVSWNSLSAVLKYKRNDDDETLKEKFSRLNIHSISKKSKRVTSHLKILTGGEPQVLTHPTADLHWQRPFYFCTGHF